MTLKCLSTAFLYIYGFILINSYTQLLNSFFWEISHQENTLSLLLIQIWMSVSIRETNQRTTFHVTNLLSLQNFMKGNTVTPLLTSTSSSLNVMGNVQTRRNTVMVSVVPMKPQMGCTLYILLFMQDALKSFQSDRELRLINFIAMEIDNNVHYT